MPKYTYKPLQFDPALHDRKPKGFVYPAKATNRADDGLEEIRLPGKNHSPHDAQYKTLYCADDTFFLNGMRFELAAHITTDFDKNARFFGLIKSSPRVSHQTAAITISYDPYYDGAEFQKENAPSKHYINSQKIITGKAVLGKILAMYKERKGYDYKIGNKELTIYILSDQMQPFEEFERMRAALAHMQETENTPESPLRDILRVDQHHRVNKAASLEPRHIDMVMANTRKLPPSMKLAAIERLADDIFTPDEMATQEMLTRFEQAVYDTLRHTVHYNEGNDCDADKIIKRAEELFDSESLITPYSVEELKSEIRGILRGPSHQQDWGIDSL